MIYEIESANGVDFIVMADGVVKVLDFGLAKLMTQDGVGDDQDTATRETAEAVLSAPGTMEAWGLLARALLQENRRRFRELRALLGAIKRSSRSPSREGRGLAPRDAVLELA